MSTVFAIPTAQEVKELPYVELLARLSESNRPPGGIDTVRQFVINCHLRPGVTVLHAGCNAGFLSRELARRSGCSVLGIDISESMVKAANARAQKEEIEHLVRHEHHDMRTMMLKQPYDVVLSGGALAFVNGHRQAVEQWLRVVSPFGLLADAELYYREAPPQRILDQVSETIGVKVPHYQAGYWQSVFRHELLEPYYLQDNVVTTYTEAEVQHYCEKMIAFSAHDWSEEAKEALLERLIQVFSLFNENLKYMNYLVFVYRHTSPNAEPALFV